MLVQYVLPPTLRCTTARLSPGLGSGGASDPGPPCRGPGMKSAPPLPNRSSGESLSWMPLSEYWPGIRIRPDGWLYSGGAGGVGWYAFLGVPPGCCLLLTAGPAMLAAGRLRLPVGTSWSCAGRRELRLSHHTSTPAMNLRSSDTNFSGDVSGRRANLSWATVFSTFAYSSGSSGSLQFSSALSCVPCTRGRHVSRFWSVRMIFHHFSAPG
mmetsp:Transcript_2136/g.5416  ORF Transcript_2136/g.5416 Transcript_2136/m.5416 type:complete len:211 (+) Transcript_2136:1234-1866(+)